MSDDKASTNIGKSVVKPSVTGPGRPKGSKNTKARTITSINKLHELGFDPLEKLVELYNKLERDIYNLTHDADGFLKDKFPTMAYGMMLASQSKIAADLMRYGYARVPELNQFENKTVLPMQIQLTGDKDTFQALGITAGTPVSFDTSKLGGSGVVYEQEVEDDDDLPMKGENE